MGNALKEPKPPAEVFNWTPDEPDVLAAQRGDDEAFARLLRRYDRPLRAYLRRFTTDEDALQDLRQETFLAVYRSLPSFACRGHFFRWMRRIASRVGFRYWAGRDRRLLASAAYVELMRDRQNEPFIHDVFAVEQVRQVLHALDPHDRTVLEMKYIHGLRAVDIAETVGCDPGLIRVRLHRALKKIRRDYCDGDCLPAVESEQGSVSIP